MAYAKYGNVGVLMDTKHDMYYGVWHDKQVEFDRIFRGYRFSDDECRALCNDELLEVHGLERNGVKYSVVGSLHESTLPNLSSEYISVKFKVDRTISFNPEYVFEKRSVSFVNDKSNGKTEVDENISVNQDPLINPEYMNEDMLRMNAELEAMLAAPFLPMVAQVSTIDSLPVFRPVLEMLSEDQIQAAVARAMQSTNMVT